MAHACRMLPDMYAPSYDFRGLDSVEALQWAVGEDVEDVTGGKSIEINTFPRTRLDDAAVRALRSAAGGVARSCSALGLLGWQQRWRATHAGGAGTHEGCRKMMRCCAGGCVEHRDSRGVAGDDQGGHRS